WVQCPRAKGGGKKISTEYLPALSAKNKGHRGIVSVVVPKRDQHGSLPGSVGGHIGAASSGAVRDDRDPPQGDLGGRVQDLEPAIPRRQALRLPLGGWGLLQRSSGRRPTVPAGVDGSHSRGEEGVDCRGGGPPGIGAIVASPPLGLQSTRDED